MLGYGVYYTEQSRLSMRQNQHARQIACMRLLLQSSALPTEVTLKLDFPQTV